MGSTAGIWVNFFKSAGIPSAIAATYAHVFHENRIQMDMLLDLNKEYLREMGITIMGDIIAILRHARNVYDQTKRDKILSIEKVPIATVSASPFVVESNNQKPTRIIRSEISTSNNNKNMQTISTNTSNFSSSSNSIVSNDNNNDLTGALNSANTLITNPNQNRNETVEMPKQTRRVLPEHEGQYKITLPTGTTERNKNILAKKVTLQTEREPGIYERLQLLNSRIAEETASLQQSSSSSILSDQISNDDSKDQAMRITSIEKPAPSIFLRLGNKHSVATNNNKIITNKQGILKTSPKLTGIVKKPLSTQKVIMVKRIPAKAATMMADEYDATRTDITGSGKFVSFSAEDEVLEIAPRRNMIKTSSNNNNDGIQNRLGIRPRSRSPPPPLPSPQTSLHKTKRIISLKAKDRQNVSVKNSLTLQKPPSSINKLTNRIGRVNLGSNDKKRVIYANNSSVFDRLGFNKV